jgi:soluble lytic murein transglycosylase-like protein
MSSATSINLTAWAAWNSAARDVYDGAVATVRLVVGFAGCLALALGAVVLANDEARGALRALLPNPVAYVVERPVEAVMNAAAEPEAAATPQASLDPRQKHVVQYLSRRYRVAEEATRLLVATAFEAGREHKLDPLLILSVVAIESSLNPFAESAMGAQGLMQVMTRVHAERFEAHGGQLAALDPVANMKVGTAILADLISRGGSVERGLQLYVGAGNLPDDGGYGARVLGERSRLALAGSGKVDAAIAAARAAAVEPKAPVEAVAPAAPQAVPTAAQPPLPAGRDA